ncbi:MAG: AMP-dependent synthetase [Haliea sp.]|nr:AMP-dependent synthetase [Haliea sp.]|tara:strand:- start:436 stop:2103 length:1668 start_codon:yes stop_codon:yes gene_type:complete
MAKNTSESLWLANPDEAAPVDLAIGDLLGEIAIEHPQREAVVYACHSEVENIRLSYAQLDAQATAFARALLAAGYTPGDHIAIWAPNNPEWTLLEYAIAKAGMVIVALNPLYKEAELAFALHTAKVRAIFHADRVADISLRSIIDGVAVKLPELRGIYALAPDIARLKAQPHLDRYELPSVHPDSPFMIQYTSGTTGQPKAAVLTHRGIATTARNSYQTWGFGLGDKVCHGFPLYHVGGSGNSTPGAALVGATTLPLYIFKAGRTLDILESERCTGFIGVPSMLTAMMEDPSFQQRDLSSLKHIVAGGMSVPARLISECEVAFGVDIINGYGQTETSGVSCSTVASDSAAIKSRTCGRPLPGVSFNIVDGEGDTLPCNQAGELCYRGPGHMLGYLNHQGPQDKLADAGWLRSGDLATMDTNGYIRIVGRASEMIIRGGENLSPAEIEAFLTQHEDVAEAAVIGVPDLKYGEEVCAVIIPRNRDHVDSGVLRSWCVKGLSRWKVPKYIQFVDAYPKTPSGKIQKFLLRDSMIAALGLHPHDDLQAGEQMDTTNSTA